MATRTFTQLVASPEKKVLTGLGTALAASDVTESVDVLNYNKIEAVAVTSGFTTGNITITAQTSQDGTNWVTLGTAATLTADGAAYILSSATTVQDITTNRYVRFTRGGDANGGSVQIQLIAANSPINLN